MPVRGIISLPGDKSISHRALMLAALTDGECNIHNLSTGLDVESTRNCLLGCGIKSKKESDHLLITGGNLRDPLYPIDCGNSGTSVRLLSGLLLGQGISAKLIGDKSLSSRPMKRIITPLKEMGGNISANN